MLEEVRIIEAGHPADLLCNPKGQTLRSMVDELGETARVHFLRIAEGVLSIIDTLRVQDEGGGLHNGG